MKIKALGVLVHRDLNPTRMIQARKSQCLLRPIDRAWERIEKLKAKQGWARLNGHAKRCVIGAVFVAYVLSALMYGLEVFPIFSGWLRVLEDAMNELLTKFLKAERIHTGPILVPDEPPLRIEYLRERYGLRSAFGYIIHKQLTLLSWIALRKGSMMDAALFSTTLTEPEVWELDKDGVPKAAPRGHWLHQLQKAVELAPYAMMRSPDPRVESMAERPVIGKGSGSWFDDFAGYRRCDTRERVKNALKESKQQISNFTRGITCSQRLAGEKKARGSASGRDPLIRSERLNHVLAAIRGAQA